MTLLLFVSTILHFIIAVIIIRTHILLNVLLLLFVPIILSSLLCVCVCVTVFMCVCACTHGRVLSTYPGLSVVTVAARTTKYLYTLTEENFLDLW